MRGVVVTYADDSVVYLAIYRDDGLVDHVSVFMPRARTSASERHIRSHVTGAKRASKR